MTHNPGACTLPDPQSAIKHAYHCTGCGWDWRLNVIVWRWFRDVPAVTG